MSEQEAPVPEDRPTWTTPVIEEAGSIHDVALRVGPGLDTDNSFAHS